MVPVRLHREHELADVSGGLARGKRLAIRDGLWPYGDALELVLGDLESVGILGHMAATEETCALDDVALLAPCPDEPPRLSIRPASGQSAIVLKWTQAAPCFQLEATEDLKQPQWSAFGYAVSQVTSVNGLTTVTVPLSSGSRFFRLQKQTSGSGCLGGQP